MAVAAVSGGSLEVRSFFPGSCFGQYLVQSCTVLSIDQPQPLTVDGPE